VVAIVVVVVVLLLLLPFLLLLPLIDYSIVGERPEIPSGVRSERKQLIERCWNQTQSQRPTMLQVLEELRRLNCKCRGIVQLQCSTHSLFTLTFWQRTTRFRWCFMLLFILYFQIYWFLVFSPFSLFFVEFHSFTTSYCTPLHVELPQVDA
jgi:hypothetical protein